MAINYDGTNIVGGPFKPYVDDQVKIRQEKLGNLNKTNEEIVWENGKSAFVALASSINIENSIINSVIDINNGEGEDVNQGGEDTTNLSGYSGIPSQQMANFILGEDVAGKTIVTTINNDGEERIKLLNLAGDPEQYFGNFLARNIVLYGGTSYYDKTLSGFLSGPNYRFGITETNNSFDDSAYGFGGTNPDGLKPMPGITSFNLKSKNMGSLRDATVTIRANSEEQFKMIDNLYCRIGYTMFLEWGNSLYFDNEGKYQKYDTQSSMISMFLSGKIIEDGVEIDLTKDPTSFISRIEARREISNGNYDAFFGRVKNFSWEYIAKGGYYEINLSLISWGDIVESLTIDGQYGTIEEEIEHQLLGTQPNKTSALTTFLNTVATPAGTTTEILNKEGEVTRSTFFQENNELFKTYLQSTKRVIEKNGYFAPPSEAEVTESGDTIPSLLYTRLKSSSGKIVSSFAQFGNQNYYYVRFGDILDFIRDRLLLYSTDSNPIVDIDTDTLKNICYSPGINMSADPSKVMVNNPIPYGFDLELLAIKGATKDKNGNIIAPTDSEKDWDKPIIQDSVFRLPLVKLENFQSKFNPDGSGDDFPLHGKIMNIYFEYQYLLSTIEGLRNEDTSKIPLFEFVDKLCKTANSCLGGVNRLSVRLEDDRIMKIYDQNSIPGTQVSDNEGATINLYGIKPTLNPSGSITGRDGSFVTDVNVKTELTNDFSTTISVGAQAQGKVVGEDATGLSTWNHGLVDRYYPFKIDSLRKSNNEREDTPEERIAKIRDQLKFLWFGYSQGGQGEMNVNPGVDGLKIKKYLFTDFPIDRYPEFVKLQKDWLAEIIFLENLKQNAQKENNSERLGTNQIGMIPINIQVTMDGLSGIRIYDKLKVDTRFLPNYYPQTLYWIIKGVSHEVVNNKWNTKLETIAVPKLHPQNDFSGIIPHNSTPNANSNNLLDSTENQYEPAQNIFSTPTTLNTFATNVNSAIGSTYNDSIKASVVFLAQQEQNLKGFNYNYYGVQTDIKWSGIEPYINGSFNSKEGESGQGDRTANARWFASFKSEADGIKFVASKLNSKGWGNIENDRIPNSQAAAEKYYGSWLFGNPNSPKVQELLEKDAPSGKKQKLWDASLKAIKDTSTVPNNMNPPTTQGSPSANIDFNSNTSFMDGDNNPFNTSTMQTSLSESNAFFENNPN